MPTTSTVAVYCRISKDQSRLEAGVNRQCEDCVALANDLAPGARFDYLSTRHLMEALFAAFADPTTRELLAGADPRLLAAVTTELDAVERDLRHLARRWGQGEIDRVEWEAAREGFAARCQVAQPPRGTEPAGPPCQ